MLWKYKVFVIHQHIFTVSLHPMCDQFSFSKTELKSEMSGFTEHSQLPTSVKKEIKEEELDDFLPEYPSIYQTVEEKPGLEYECKTEMYTSPTMTLNEEKYSPMEIKN